MGGLPALRSSVPVRSTPAVATLRGGPQTGAPSTSVALVERSGVRVVEPAAPFHAARPRDEASAVLLAQVRDEVAKSEASTASRDSSSRASLAYRKSGALPELYEERPLVFSIRI